MTLDPIAELTIPITLGNNEYRMRFSGNTMCAYEQETGKFFLSTVSDLFDAVFPEGVPKDGTSKVKPMEVMKRVADCFNRSGVTPKSGLCSSMKWRIVSADGNAIKRSNSSFSV